MSIKEVLEQAQKDYEKLFVKCSECKYSMFSDFYLECRKGIISIANRNSGCIFGEKRLPKGSEPSKTKENAK